MFRANSGAPFDSGTLMEESARIQRRNEELKAQRDQLKARVRDLQLAVLAQLIPVATIDDDFPAYTP
jgi:hypothetical protein